MKQMPIGYYFIVAASVIVVLAGIKSASALVIPFLLSLFIAIILSPSYSYLRSKKVPDFFSLVIVLVSFVVILGLIAGLVGSSVQDFSANIDNYTQKLTKYYVSLVEFAANFGLSLSTDELASFVNSKQIMVFASSFIKSMGSVFTNGFVILLSVAFMLLESQSFAKKVMVADKNSVTFEHIQTIFSKIKKYMMLKSLMSLATGFIIWLALRFMGVDYPFLWATLAFLLNFIPNIGSIIAAIPAVLIALVQLGSMSASLVALVYLLTNITIGSILEPRVMGRGLGLSTLVVFLSLLFWGWLLGLVGMLLSIPLTIMAKIVLSENRSTRWIAVMLGTGEVE